MADMYSKIEQLCKENNTNITAMCRLLDISRSTLSELKAGRTKTLSAEYTTKIASYFQLFYGGKFGDLLVYQIGLIIDNKKKVRLFYENRTASIIF